MNTAAASIPSPRTGIDHSIAWPLLIAHAVALAAPFCFRWHALIGFCVMYLISGLGVTAGAHRYFTHQSYTVSPLMRRILTLMFMLAAQGSLIRWVRDHHIHHAHSDRPGDPHTPHHGHGFWHAQMLWLWKKPPTPQENKQLYQRYAKTLENDRFASALARPAILIPFHITVILLAFLIGCICEAGPERMSHGWQGGIAMVTWAIFLRIVCVLHATNLVNSLAHIQGYRTYQTREESRNNPLVALLSLGEGWHNNHHARPAAANQGFHRWWEFDLTMLFLIALGALGLLRDLRVFRPSKGAIQTWFPTSTAPKHEHPR